MRQINLIRLKPILLIALIVTATAFTATAQTSFVPDSATIQPVLSGARPTNADDVCEQRLLKALDALEKSEALIGFKDKEIAARVNLEALYKQAIEVKDLIIKFQDELIRKLQKPNSGFMGRLKSILRTAERVILLAAGVYVGGRL